ncbi:helix-turn-helix domain-containing protein [Psychrobacter sp. FDAARGOS_221]|uniref:helix-turn-helix domain-containing protein n=1 Tax=Psychrobacter sp. FDAARGOS_221 TaxID=1975705 RepID=UPI000BB5848B|nr:helix-turn-helix transcriptional regulator [Psychrobacter sp. FDAARGOS_221]PNK60164.1 XRE family transcriptional regulator [Psychrobacter sp. FDAARGOS_221]
MLNDALKKIRLFHNMKQNELSQQLNISNSYLSEIESGKKPPSIELLQSYATVFDIPVSSLLYFSEQLENEGKISKSFRIKSAGFVLKLLDWSIKSEQKETKGKS